MLIKKDNGPPLDKPLQPCQSLHEMRKLLRRGGLIQVGVSNRGNSYYFSRPGVRWVLRIADHQIGISQMDTVYSWVVPEVITPRQLAKVATMLVSHWTENSALRERTSSEEERALCLGRDPIRNPLSQWRLRAVKGENQ